MILGWSFHKAAQAGPSYQEEVQFAQKLIRLPSKATGSWEPRLLWENLNRREREPVLELLWHPTSICSAS